MEFAYFDIVLALLAIAGFCAFLTLRCRLHASLAPLCTLALFSTVLTVAGVVGVLQPAAWLLYAAGFGLGGWALLCAARRAPGTAPATLGQPAQKPLWQQLLPPGAVVFWLLALSFAVYFAVRKPLFAEYDEFSFWGTAAKLTCTQNVLYSEARVGWPWAATQNSGLITLCYFFQLFGSFAAWKVHLAYDVLLFACFGAVVGLVPWRRYTLAFPAATACFFTPFVFCIYQQQRYVSHIYMLAYGDIPAGVVFGGAVVFWLVLRRQNGPFWAVLPVLALAANIKANTFVLALAASGIIAADLLLFSGGARWLSGLPARIGKAVAAFVPPALVYAVWNVWYVGRLVQSNAESGGLGDTADQSLVAIAVNGIKMVLGLPVGDYYEQRRERFVSMFRQLWQAFCSSKITMLGSGLVVVAVLAVLALWAVLLAPTAGARLRIAAVWLLAAACFVAYNFMLLLSYAFVFQAASSGDGLLDYNRYLYSYYLGWFLLTLALLLAAAQATRWRLPADAGTLALACAMVLCFSRYVAPDLCVLGYADSEFAEAEIRRQEAEQVVQAITQDPARVGEVSEQDVFFVSQGDNGLLWFQFSYELLPVMLDYGDALLGGGGGTYGLPELNDGSEYYYHAYTAQELMSYLQQNCEYLLVDRLDELFYTSYAQLFTDGLAGVGQGTALYRVQADGLVLVQSFAPIG